MSEKDKEDLLKIGVFDISRTVSVGFKWVEQITDLIFIYEPYIEDIRTWLKETDYEYDVVYKKYKYFIIFKEHIAAMEFKLRFFDV